MLEPQGSTKIARASELKAVCQTSQPLECSGGLSCCYSKSVLLGPTVLFFASLSKQSHVCLTLGCKAPTTADENVARQRVLCPAIGARGIAPYKIFLDQGEHSLPAGSRSGATFKYS